MGLYNLQPIFAGEPFNILKPYTAIKHTCNPGSNIDSSVSNGVNIYDPGDITCPLVTVTQAYRVERIRVHLRVVDNSVCTGTTPTIKLYLMAKQMGGVPNGAIIQEKLIPSITTGYSTSMGFVEFVFDGGLVLRNCVGLYLAQNNSSEADLIFDVYGELSSLDFIDYGI